MTLIVKTGTLMHADAKKKQIIWQVATGLRNRLEQKIHIPNLAAEAGLSERQFHRLFHSALGESPAAHMRRLRLERSATWLAYTDFPVIDAALAGGYNSREGFTREFHEHFGCAPGAFRKRVRSKLRRIPAQSPTTLGKPYELALPQMRLVAWPHLGSGNDAVATWMTFGRWAVKNNLLTPHTLPISVLYDDELITPSAYARLDATLVVDPHQNIDECDGLPAVYNLVGGRHVIIPFSGSLYDLKAAWVWFALRWFPVSGYALRDARMLMLHDPMEVPKCVCDYFPLIIGKAVHCRLCIPIDYVPASGLPPIQSQCLKIIRRTELYDSASRNSNMEGRFISRPLRGTDGSEGS
ncbi:MAG: helix-turn-helix domain-containing protein [Kiritimatiellae bacterium]|jgi:AraC family transcriptional regulator|nr:helix-turn-helix domain-containing protein [Kiritimatiellia bacterium]